MDSNKDLVKKLEFLSKSKYGIEKDEVAKILCRVRCNDVGYTLIEKKGTAECIWYSDSLIINIQE